VGEAVGVGVAVGVVRKNKGVCVAAGDKQAKELATSVRVLLGGTGREERCKHSLNTAAGYR